MDSSQKKKLLLITSALLLVLSAPILLFVLFNFTGTTFASITNQGAAFLTPLLFLGVLLGIAAAMLIAAKAIRSSAIAIPVGFLLPCAFIGCLCGLIIEYRVHQVPTAVWGLFYGTLEIPTISLLFIAYAQFKFSIISPRA